MNTNQEHGTNKVEHYRKQVMEDIKKVRSDFDEIKHRLTPGQIIDDAIYYRRGGGDPADTFNYLKANPIGASFLTLGTLMLMEGQNHQSFERQGKTKIEEFRAKYAGKINEMRAKASDARGAVEERIDDIRAKVEDVKIKYGETVDKIKGVDEEFDTGTGIYSNVSGLNVAGTKFDDRTSQEGTLSTRAQDIKSRLSLKTGEMKSRLTDVSDELKTRGHNALETVKHLDPLTYFVLGAGLGVMTGVSIPLSSAEERFTGQIQDKFSGFRGEFEEALNASVNILKNEFIGDAAKFNFKIF